MTMAERPPKDLIYTRLDSVECLGRKQLGKACACLLNRWLVNKRNQVPQNITIFRLKQESPLTYPELPKSTLLP